MSTSPLHHHLHHHLLHIFINLLHFHLIMSTFHQITLVTSTSHLHLLQQSVKLTIDAT
ncbi:hypothetical protein Lalb_Chr16g0390441 [Lupinus albus]|uniref:Uncharacterized protein n=1 Tax=Lupinus albus TaxID=3870 RepID=A0A6A4PCP5_LUPAL|nr:hypothetical protein Lalb_Chr16g0390441 [Lupinus albus]